MVKRFLFLFLILPLFVYAQEEPEDNLEVDFNSYFDNFRLVVFYPSINLNKKVDSKTSLNFTYLVDAISSASMRMTLKFDGITSATPNINGGGDDKIDEFRHQFNLGINRYFGDLSVNLNGMYSTEHDYSSKTFAVNLTYPFAKKNTILQTGFAGNWDKIFPQTRTWTKDRNTQTYNVGLSQILSKKLIAQLDFSYINVDGFMNDGYQIVRILNGSHLLSLEPVAPDKRIRRAFGVRANYGLTNNSTLNLGYRYYWDSWKIFSNTFEAGFKTHLNKNINIGINYRQYFQTNAFFFKPVYTQVEDYIVVDSKLNSGYTNDVTLSMDINGDKSFNFPFLNNENVTFISKLGFYHRHTDSPDWFSKMMDLYAYLITLGFKYNF